MTDKIENLEELEQLEPSETNWVLWVGSDSRDFIAGAENGNALEHLVEKLPIMNNKAIIYNQDYGIFDSACTIVSSYTLICSYFNHQPSEKEMTELVNYCTTKGYVIGEGWRTRLGVKYASKFWNARNPDKKVVYFATEYDEPTTKKALAKGYWLVRTFRGCREYVRDRNADGIVDSKHFRKKDWGHCIKELSGVLEDNYPNRKYNSYTLRYPLDLIEDKVFYSWNYLILPELQEDQEEMSTKLKMMLQVLGKINQKIHTHLGIENPSCREELQQALHLVNDTMRKYKIIPEL